MSQMFPIATSGDFRFDPDELVRKARDRWPDAEVVWPDDPHSAQLTRAFVYLPETSPGWRPELRIDNEGLGVTVTGADPTTAATVAVWVAGAAPVPDDGSVVLAEWGDDLYPLRPNTTVEQLLAAFR